MVVVPHCCAVLKTSPAPRVPSACTNWPAVVSCIEYTVAVLLPFWVVLSMYTLSVVPVALLMATVPGVLAFVVKVTSLPLTIVLDVPYVTAAL